MCNPLAALVASAVLASGLAAQTLGYDDFTWTFAGPPTSAGFMTSELLHVTGPSLSSCFEAQAVFTTVAPWAGTVRAHLEWDIQDICHYDWPIYTVNGQFVKIPVSGDLSCFLPGAFEVEFDVQAGDEFGLGVGSTDCDLGPGLADFTEFSFTPPEWIDAGGALDPRVVFEIAAPNPSETFGSSLAAVGDVDGDGQSEIAVGGFRYVGFVAQQTISVHSGADGAVLWETTGPKGLTPGLVAPGDVDGDGAPDLAVSNFLDNRVQMLSALDGDVLWTWTWNGSPGAWYGRSLAAPTDVDGDGVLDLAVGSPALASLPVIVLSGASGAELAQVQPGPLDVSFGLSLGAPGDIDGDGLGDLMVAALGPPARVTVRSGSTGAELFELHSPSAAATPWDVTALAGVGDWNGDGILDMAVGAPYDEPSPATGGQGSVTLFSGATGGMLLSLQAPADAELFGDALAGGLDVDGDGAPDLAIGAPEPEVFNPEGGQVHVVRAPDGALLQEILGSPGTHPGDALVWQPGAPLPTLAVGITADTADGRVRLYSHLLHPAGAPALAMWGAMEPGSPWSLRLDHGLPGGVAYLVAGLTASSLPFKGGVLVPAPNLVVPVLLDGAGVFELTTVAPAGITPAITLWLQAWMLDPAGPHGWSATNAQQSPAP